MKTTYIYALRCPVSGLIKYIGKTVDPKQRLNHHIQIARLYQVDLDRKTAWIKDLLSSGHRPIMEIIERCDASDSQTRERYWMHRYKSATQLLNISDTILSVSTTTEFDKLALDSPALPLPVLALKGTHDAKPSE